MSLAGFTWFLGTAFEQASISTAARLFISSSPTRPGGCRRGSYARSWSPRTSTVRSSRLRGTTSLRLRLAGGRKRCSVGFSPGNGSRTQSRRPPARSCLRVCGRARARCRGTAERLGSGPPLGVLLRIAFATIARDRPAPCPLGGGGGHGTRRRPRRPSGDRDPSRPARALGDPSLVVGYRLPATGALVDEAGRTVHLPSTGSGREVTSIAVGGHQIAVLVHDEALLADRKLLESVAAAAQFAVANAALQAEARSRRRARRVAPTHCRGG